MEFMNKFSEVNGNNIDDDTILEEDAGDFEFIDDATEFENQQP